MAAAWANMREEEFRARMERVARDSQNNNEAGRLLPNPAPSFCGTLHGFRSFNHFPDLFLYPGHPGLEFAQRRLRLFCRVWGMTRRTGRREAQSWIGVKNIAYSHGIMQTVSLLKPLGKFRFGHIV